MNKATSFVASLGKQFFTGMMIAVLLCGSNAFAAEVTGTPQKVKYVSQAAYRFLLVTIGGTNYYFQLYPAAGCSLPTASTDDAKAFQSLATSALLSGKSVTLTYQYCASDGNNYAYQLELQQ